MSVRSVKRFPSSTRPILIPATGCRIGTPASISASVALHTDAVPAAALGDLRHGRRMHRRRTAGYPAMVCDQLNGRKLTEQAAVPGRVPIDLLVMRPGRHHHLPADAWRGTALPVPIRLVEVGPQLAPSLLEKHRPARHSVHACAVEIADDGFGRGDLRHGSVIRLVPRGILTRMAGLARLGR